MYILPKACPTIKTPVVISKVKRKNSSAIDDFGSEKIIKLHDTDNIALTERHKIQINESQNLNNEKEIDIEEDIDCNLTNSSTCARSWEDQFKELREQMLADIEDFEKSFFG